MRPTLLLAIPLVLSGTGCVDRPVSEVIPSGTHVETITVPTTVERDVDILFVIDSSSSMTEEHEALRDDFATLLDRLDDGPDGLPNVHIGVVSSDMGTAPFDVDTQCRADGGDRGLLLGSGCPALGGNTFLSDVRDPDGARRTNYTGSLQAAFGCTSNVGSTGCGFEQHLAAMRAALSPGTNPDFLRAEAALAVIIIADEDDCSVMDPGLFDENDASLGPLTDFRCHREGIVCDDNPDPSAPGAEHGCRPDPSSPFLESLETYADFLVDLKGGRRDKVMVAGIIGDPTEVTIGRDAFDRPTVLAACPAGGLGASEPGIRFNDFFQRFTNRSQSTLCAGDLSGGLDAIGTLIGQTLGTMCLKNPVADRNPTLGGVQPECSLTEHLAGSDKAMPMCGAPGAGTPCWSIVTDAACTETQQRLEIDRGGALAPEDGTISVQCVVES